jgi:RNA polymerase sigma factor (sigma-70 family)
LVVDRAHAPNASIGTLIARARTVSDRSSPRHDPSQPLRVLLADDSYLIREALHEVVGAIDAIDLVDSFGDGDSLLAAVEADPPDVVITDIRMPPSGDDEGIRIARRLRETHPEVGVIVLSQYAGTAYALALLEDGAEGRGYLLKERVHDRSELLAAIEVVAQGGTTIDPSVVQELLAADRQRHSSPLDELTPREREVLQLIARGYMYKEIAARLHLSVKTVESHVSNVLRKLQLSTRHELTRWATQHRLV